ncbi:MAG: NUDIX domain-containing protein [Nocardioides sp.]
MPPRPDVLAAGAVVWRHKQEVLLVHRPRYDDWSFPKGKLDRGERLPAAAVREVAEETGLHVRLGPPLQGQRYPHGDRMKSVSYWVGWVVGPDDVGGYLVNDEIDDVAWVPWQEALQRLSYPHDCDTLLESRPLRRKTRALVVLRHASARSRKRWRKDDRERPLLQSGHHQSLDLVPLLAAYDATRVTTSSSRRCVQTVTPYTDLIGRPPEAYDGLSEEDATAEAVVDLLDDLLEADTGSVLCTHRTVLPSVLDALGVPEVALDPAGMLVAHHRSDRVVATELHRA